MHRERIIQFLGRFVPPVARGLALGFGILAIATAASLTGDYATATDRYLVAGLYAAIAIASLAISRAVQPVLRRFGEPRQ